MKAFKLLRLIEKEKTDHKRGGNIIKFIRLVILLIPMPFLFHYIEISLSRIGGTLAFTITFIYIIFAGLIAVKSKYNFVFLINTLGILLSILLGQLFITAPNESWFNPFSMSTVIILTGIVIQIGILIVRFLARLVFKSGKISNNND